MELRLIAARIEENRVVAGVHYENDGHMGRVLAAALSPVFAARLGLMSQSPQVQDVEQKWKASGETGVFDAAEALGAGSTWSTGGGAQKPTLASDGEAARFPVLQTVMQLVQAEIGDQI